MYKVGKCKDCSYQGKLIAGRCQGCYWKYRASLKNKSKEAIEKKETKKNLNFFFGSQILQIPDFCEECNGSLKYWKSKNPRMLVAHILPKRPVGGFPSVSTHPLNRLFLCPDCHSDMDNKGQDHVKSMKTYKLMIQRLKQFSHLITEKKELPNGFSNFV